MGPKNNLQEYNFFSSILRCYIQIEVLVDHKNPRLERWKNLGQSTAAETSELGLTKFF